MLVKWSTLLREVGEKVYIITTRARAHVHSHSSRVTIFLSRKIKDHCNHLSHMALVSQTGSSSCIHFSFVPPYTARKTKISYAYNARVGKMKPRPSVIVAASPPTEAAVIATEPLTKEDLIGHLASGCKPKEKWR